VLCAPILAITFYLSTCFPIFRFCFRAPHVSNRLEGLVLCPAACNFTPSTIKWQFLRLSQMTFMFPNGYILYQIEIAQTNNIDCLLALTMSSARFFLCLSTFCFYFWGSNSGDSSLAMTK